MSTNIASPSLEAQRALLEAEIAQLRRELDDAQETLTAISRGRIDALVVEDPVEERQVLMLESAERQRDADETLRAIQRGEVDAFVMARGSRTEVELLSSAHRPYRVLVENMQQGAVTLAPSGEMLYLNQPLAAMLGRPLAELIGGRFQDFVAEADRPTLTALIAQSSMRHGVREPVQQEVALLHESGSLVPALCAVAFAPEDRSICLMVTDLSAKKAYEAIVAARALERSILDQAVDAIVVCDTRGRVIRASGAAFDLCGQNPLLLPFADSFPLAAPGGPPDLDSVIAGSATLRGHEYALRRSATRDATVLLSAGPVIDPGGATRGCVVTMTDITERRRIEDRLRESDRHKDEFLAILGHELRNPLAPIASAVEILRASELTKYPNAAYAVDVIGRQTASLTRLVDDLLDINRINQGKIALQIELIDMRSVVDQAIEVCRPLVDERGHELAASLPHDAVRVHGDAARLTQVIVNLLTNAARYTPRGGRIEVTLERSMERPAQAVLCVADNGIGIAADTLARIFEPYQQAGQPRAGTTGGLGLGLTVCRRLMEMHGGTVDAYSAGPARGSRFVARLPLAETSAR